MRSKLRSLLLSLRPLFWLDACCVCSEPTAPGPLVKETSGPGAISGKKTKHEKA